MIKQWTIKNQNLNRLYTYILEQAKSTASSQFCVITLNEETEELTLSVGHIDEPRSIMISRDKHS